MTPRSRRRGLTDADLCRRAGAARRYEGLTQEEAAKQLGLSRPVLAHIERGARHLSAMEVYNMARLYKVDLVGFFFRERDDQ